MIYNIVPVAKPRMTHADRRIPRPAVQKYWAFKAEVQLRKVEVPEAGAWIIFKLPMPKSWSKKKRAEMCGLPHQQTPDTDNLTKALLDSVYKNDAHIWDYRVSKRWAETGSIEVTEL